MRELRYGGEFNGSCRAIMDGRKEIAVAISEPVAARIVKCVNCHDDLLDALEDAASVLSGENMSKSCLIRALEKAGAAIRKAEGKPQ